MSFWKNLFLLKREQVLSTVLLLLARSTFMPAQRAGIDLVCPVDGNGRFTQEIPEYTGLFVKDADKDIIKRLKHQGDVFQHATFRHRYPFCWRSDTPLIYKAVRTWFVAVEKIKEDLLASNEEIHWTPGTYQAWTIWKMAGRSTRLGHQPKSLLGNSHAYLACRRW